MGNSVSLNLFSCDQNIVNGIVRCLCGKGYIRNLKKNLKTLEKEMVDLKAIQHDVQNKVAIEERKHRQRLEVVQVWLNRVENVGTRFKDLVSTSSIQIEQLFLCGMCSNTICSSYVYGKTVFLLLKDVKSLISESNFEVVAELNLRLGVDELPTQPTIGQEVLLEKACNRIMDDEVGFMGLHGMGGVGKTTLFRKLHNRMASEFDNVIWIVVSQGVQISKLQDDIAEKLHIFGERWTDKKDSDKAAEIHRVLNGERFVLMLDDIWEKVDIVAIGIPFPTRENGCKVTFTTRSKEVCNRMGDHEPMQVKCLEEDESWQLFKNKVGEITLRSDPDITELAKKVVKKCDGLPLALNLIGETMASKTTIQEWEHAIDVLTQSTAEFSDMENKILPIVKYSYERLADENIKSCFLYCALFPEDYSINQDMLINYWICEGFIGEYQVLKRAMNKGYEVLGTLIRANLLTEVGKTNVVMHDVVREMALWTSNLWEMKDNVIVQAKVGISEIPKVKDWGVVTRVSLMNNKIEEITCNLKCSELTTLFLQDNKLKSLSGKSISSMKKLVVLDLHGNKNFIKLPEQISELSSLRYIDLSYTIIEQLPIGFHNLKKLTHLGLTSTRRLHSLCGISKFSSLITLKLQDSNVHGDVSLLKELQLLEHLQVLTITISTMLGLELISSDRRLMNCIDTLVLHSFHQTLFNISLLASMENLRELKVRYSHFLDSFDIHNLTRGCFTKLSFVSMYSCYGMKDLTWLLFAPNLVSLEIVRLIEVEEIINKDKAANLTGIITPFQKLEKLELISLPYLKSIYRNPLPFPHLQNVQIFHCQKLKKLPFNALSVPQLQRFGLEVDLRDQVEWEDEDTKNRFVPLITKCAEASFAIY